MRAVDPETRSGGLERFDGVQHAPKSLFGQLQIMAGLHPQPETFAEAEETAQAQIGVGTDRPPPLHDRVDAALRYADRQRQPVLTDAHRSEELLQQHLARMHQQQVSGNQRFRPPLARLPSRQSRAGTGH